MLSLSQDFCSTSSSGTGGGIILGSASEVTVTVAIAAREGAIRLSEKYPMPDVLEPWSPKANGTANLNSDHAIGQNGKSAAEVGKEATLDANGRLAAWKGKLTCKLVMYGTTQTHSVGTKAALILGLDFKALDVKAEDAYALTGETLRAAIQEDERQGRVPFMLVGTVGTTNSGATDKISEIAEITKDHPTLWLHIDSAYAGVTLSLPEVREEAHLDSINKHVHSFSTNLHKWGLMVQCDCSSLLVRDRGELSRALTVTPEFLRTKHGDAGNVLDLRNLQMSLGRRFRSLKVCFGQEGFRAHLRRCVSLTNVFEKAIRIDSLFEIVATPKWTLVVFRLNPGSAGINLDALNRAFWEALYSADFVLTQTILPSIGFCIRFVVGSPQTEEHVTKTWQLIQEFSA